MGSNIPRPGSPCQHSGPGGGALPTGLPGTGGAEQLPWPHPSTPGAPPLGMTTDRATPVTPRCRPCVPHSFRLTIGGPLIPVLHCGKCPRDSLGRVPWVCFVPDFPATARGGEGHPWGLHRCCVTRCAGQRPSSQEQGAGTDGPGPRPVLLRVCLERPPSSAEQRGVEVPRSPHLGPWNL